MFKFIKNNLFFLILFVVQGYFFISKYLDSQIDYELHFLTWCVLWFACFFFSLRSRSGINSGLGMGASKSDPITYSMINKTEVNYPKATDDKVGQKLHSLLNIYLLLSLINLIAYIVTVIIIY